MYFEGARVIIEFRKGKRKKRKQGEKRWDGLNKVESIWVIEKYLLKGWLKFKDICDWLKSKGIGDKKHVYLSSSLSLSSSQQRC